MKNQNIDLFVQDYMDEDVAYLLGLIISSGTIYEVNDDRRLLLNFSYRTLTIATEEQAVDQKTQLSLSINRIRTRLADLLAADISVNESEGNVQIVCRFLKNTIEWRDIRLLTQYKHNYLEFVVPEQISKNSQSVQREFIRGIADASGFIRESNRDQVGRHRVYIQISNKNWLLPIQLCEILQLGLGVSVPSIQWGHPNIREPKADSTGWPKEHQIRIYADDFIKIGFGIKYKQELLEELANANKEKFDKETKKCNPLMKRVRTIKPKHRDENSENLPDNLRGKHFNAYWQVCKKLGCKQGCRMQEVFFEEE